MKQKKLKKFWDKKAFSNITWVLLCLTLLSSLILSYSMSRSNRPRGSALIYLHLLLEGTWSIRTRLKGGRTTLLWKHTVARISPIISSTTNSSMLWWWGWISTQLSSTIHSPSPSMTRSWSLSSTTEPWRTWELLPSLNLTYSNRRSAKCTELSAIIPYCMSCVTCGLGI